MSPLIALKWITIGGWALGMLLWATASSFPKSTGPERSRETPSLTAKDDQESDYLGSDACEVCHEDQFKSFSRTQHAKLANITGWRKKVTGCEQCHGPGRAHVEAGGDITKIISFTNKPSKDVSEVCLSCHAGKEEHNNFRRGEHYRNDVGCTDCHSPHNTEVATNRPGSITFISEASRHKPDSSTLRMLKVSEPQLCLTCHTEMRAQFNMPFHHKVLEGLIKCSDCHNPHGGFEQRQTRLAIGADVVCLKCHTDKQGPFVFEHQPLKFEGCTACHNPHGSGNSKLLIRNQVRQLCLECHTNAHETGPPNTPSFHDQTTRRFQNCTTCHVKIHGSQVDPDFFR